MELKYNLQHQVVANTAAIANLTTQAADIETDISGLSQRVADTETDILDLNARTLKRSVLPGAPKIVSLATDGSQANLSLGENLSIENGVLNAAGGGGGTKLYLHSMQIIAEDDSFFIDIIATTSQPITSLNDLASSFVCLKSGYDPSGAHGQNGGDIFAYVNNNKHSNTILITKQDGTTFYIDRLTISFIERDTVTEL